MAAICDGRRATLYNAGRTSADCYDIVYNTLVLGDSIIIGSHVIDCLQSTIEILDRFEESMKPFYIPLWRDHSIDNIRIAGYLTTQRAMIINLINKLSNDLSEYVSECVAIQDVDIDSDEDSTEDNFGIVGSKEYVNINRFVMREGDNLVSKKEALYVALHATKEYYNDLYSTIVYHTLRVMKRHIRTNFYKIYDVVTDTLMTVLHANDYFTEDDESNIGKLFNKLRMDLCTIKENCSSKVLSVLHYN